MVSDVMFGFADRDQDPFGDFVAIDLDPALVANVYFKYIAFTDALLRGVPLSL